MVSEAMVTIESIAAGGDGVARLGDLVLFVPRSAPGDSGLVSYSMRDSFARGSWTRLEKASPQRVDPRCVHYEKDRCGGCQLQHMEYGAQLRAKDRVVSDAMQRIARRDVPGITMHRSESEWRYRRKLTFELRRDRESFHAGLHPYDNPSALFTPGDCLITQVQVMDAWHQVLANVHHLPRARRLRCSVLVLDDGAHLSVGGGNAWTDAEALAEACPALVSISWTPSGGSRKRVFSRGTETRAGASFAQINDSVARALRDFVCAMAMRLSPADAVDAYCGTGEVALALSALGVRVSAIESDPDAVSMFRSLLPEGSTASVGLVEDLVAAVLPTDLVLLNPPRSGIEAKVALALARAGAVRKGIIYISCNPATLARDLARLPGFIVQSLDCFDMFPQTAHVETVCLLLSPAQS